MLNIREYVKVQSLEEAYELNQKRTNKIIGGMLWMKMGDRNIQKAIDLSGLGLAFVILLAYSSGIWQRWEEAFSDVSDFQTC